MGAFKATNNNLRGKRVMVTGAAGFIGSHLCEAIQACNPEALYAVDNLSLGKMANLAGLHAGRTTFLNIDAARYDEMKPALDDGKIDVVFNLAVIPLPHSLEKPWENFEGNTRIVNNLCELQRQKAFKTLVHFSSSETYGSAQYEPMDEKHPLGPSTPYAASKAAGDLLALSYARTFGMQTAILRPFNTYGPRQNEGSYAGVIPITVQRILKGKDPIVTGDGTQTRDYAYVKDVADAALQTYQRIEKTQGKVTNMGSGRETAILVLVMMIGQLMEEIGYKYQGIQNKPPRAGDVRRHIANIYQAVDLLDYDPAMAEPLSSGLRKTVRWYIENTKGARKNT